LMPSGFTQHLFPNVHLFKVPLAALFLPCPWQLCHSYTAGRPSVGSGQLLPGPTLALGLFLLLFAAPYN
jgi:hypothetical protein